MLCVCANCACVNVSQTTEMYPHRSEFDVTVLEHSAVAHFRIGIALSDTVQMDTDYLLNYRQKRQITGVAGKIIDGARQSIGKDE